MSVRALRRLREEREATLRQDGIEEEDSDSEDDDATGKAGMAFTFKDDSESSGDDGEGDEEEIGEDNDAEENDEWEVSPQRETQSDQTVQQTSASIREDTKVEDLDALLAEFEFHDKGIILENTKLAPKSSFFQVITSSVDPRDLDFDYVMRTTLLGGSEAAETSSRRSRNAFLFGPPRDGWQKPPHYVGGGIGMTSYDQDPYDLPWPYQTVQRDDDNELAWSNRKQWYTFMYSNTYTKDLEDYKRIQESGDANALAMFVSHHPFVTEALMQLAAVLYQTNQSQDGLSLIRRTLWIYESSSLMGFSPHKDQSCFMDKDRKENAVFFMALFRLMQVSSIAGCIRTSLAVSRFLLAMDPLRDPMGVLLIMDCFALQTMSDEYCQFVIEIVESLKIEIHYQDDAARKEHVGTLLNMPNWAYSYSLALYRLGKSKDDEAICERANEALQNAVRQFPAVVEQLLVKNELDMTGRSFRTDWATVLTKLRSIALTPPSTGYDPIIHHATTQAAQVITNVFVKRNFKQWSSNSIVTWLYDACAVVTAEESKVNSSLPIHPSILRYALTDPADYDDQFRHLPPEANPLDPNLVAAALVVDPNRRRLFRGGGGFARGVENEEFNQQLNGGILGGQGLMIGGRPTNNIDPDDPMLEIFLRSLLPWNHVDGIPPPR